MKQHSGANMNKFPNSHFAEDEYLMGLFYSILSAHPEVVQRFKTDLIHDGLWLERNIYNTPKDNVPIDMFYFGLREAGTLIGTDRDFVKLTNTVLYEIKVTRRTENEVFGVAQQIEILSPKEQRQCDEQANLN
jgi:hypothetical protein